MIDLIKIYRLPVTVDHLLSIPLLNFSLNAYTSGELNTKDQRAYYKDFTFTLNRHNNGKDDKRTLVGSLHKSWNDGKHNYNGFSFQNVVAVIKDLQDKIGIDPRKCRLNNIEFGVNVTVDFNPEELLRDLIHHLQSPFVRMNKGIGRSAEHMQYFIKIYNKGLQYSLPYHVLRIEIKVRTMDYLHSKGIRLYTLADLLDVNIHRQLADNILQRFNEILFYDTTIHMDSLPEKQQLILSNARVPDYWESLPSKSDRDYFLKQYKKIYNDNVKQDWKKIIGPMIKQKTEELISNAQTVHPPPKELSISLQHDCTLNDCIVEVSDSVKTVIQDLQPGSLHINKPSFSGNDLGNRQDYPKYNKVSDGRKTDVTVPEMIDKLDKVSDRVSSTSEDQHVNDHFKTKEQQKWAIAELENFFHD